MLTAWSRFAILCGLSQISRSITYRPRERMRYEKVICNFKYGGVSNGNLHNSYVHCGGDFAGVHRSNAYKNIEVTEDLCLKK